MAIKFQAIAIALNEEMAITSWIKQWKDITDDVCVLVDNKTMDKTPAIANYYGAKVSFGEFVDFSQFRNLAISTFVNDANYIAFTDPDEQINQHIRTEMLRVKNEGMTDPDIEVYLSPLKAIHPNNNWYFPGHPKEWLIKNCGNTAFILPAHEKVASPYKAIFTKGEIEHYLIWHPSEKRDEASKFYDDLLKKDPYWTNPRYRQELDAKYPLLQYDHLTDSRIQEVEKL